MTSLPGCLKAPCHTNVYPQHLVEALQLQKGAMVVKPIFGVHKCLPPYHDQAHLKNS